MRENEIAIGDFFTYGEVPIQIENIYTVDICGEKHYAVNWDNQHADVKILQPIPITEEFVTNNRVDQIISVTNIKQDKFDFVCDENEFELYKYSDDGWWVAAYIDSNPNIRPQRIMIRYIHELQHLFTHFGIHKEITL